MYLIETEKLKLLDKTNNTRTLEIEKLTREKKGAL